MDLDTESIISLSHHISNSISSLSFLCFTYYEEISCLGLLPFIKPHQGSAGE